MKQYIYAEFAKPELNVPEVVKKISTGKPIKLFGYIHLFTEALDLFTPDGEGRNIFHYLAIKGKLGLFLDSFFGPNVSTDMLQREGANHNSLLSAINSNDKYGYSVFEFVCRYEFDSVYKIASSGYIQENIKAVMKKYNDKLFASGYEKIALEFLKIAILEGDKDFFNEPSGKQLYPHLPFIVQTVQELHDNPQYPKTLEAFIYIFQKFWPDIFSHPENCHNLEKIKYLSKVGTEPITLEQWAKLLGQPNFENIDQVRNYILGQAAKRFLEGTVYTMKFEDLIVNKDAVKSDQLTELTKEIKTISETAAASDDTIVKTVAAELIGKTAIPNTVGEKSKNTRPDLNPSSASSKQSGETLSVKQLADKITNLVWKAEKYMDRLKKDLGEPPAEKKDLKKFPYNQLHSFISLIYNKPQFFDETLKKFAEKINTTEMSGNDFLTRYIQTITEKDLLDLTNTKIKKNALDLVCSIKNAHLAKLLLDKGLELKIYSADDLSTHFQAIIKYNAPEIMSGLLQRSGITIDWYYLLLQAMKYCNDASKYTIDYYVAHEELHIVKDVRSREGKIETDPKYTLLNKALFNLCILASHSYKEDIEENIHTASIKKLLVLSELVEKLLSSNKIDYAENNLLVCTKTLSLLKHFARCINKMPENDKTLSSIAAANTIMHKMLDQYEVLTLPPDASKALTKLKAWIDNLDDNQSQRSSMSAASDITHLSVLSGIDDLDLDSYDLEYMNTSGTEIMALGESNA
jgi:hypothetical protein